MFWTLEQRSRYVAFEEMSEKPLADATPDLLVRRQPPGEFDHPMVEEWGPDFEAGAHAGAIHLDEDVVRKIPKQVEEHHSVGGVC